jgi:hypothetical protein
VPDWDNTESRESDEDAAWRDLVARFDAPLAAEHPVPWPTREDVPAEGAGADEVQGRAGGDGTHGADGEPGINGESRVHEGDRNPGAQGTGGGRGRHAADAGPGRHGDRDSGLDGGRGAGGLDGSRGAGGLGWELDATGLTGQEPRARPGDELGDRPGGRHGRRGASARHDPEVIQVPRTIRGPARDEDEHYIPPAPPPLPKLDPIAKGAWAALFGGPGYLVVATAAGWSVSGLAAFLAVAAFIAGFVLLVLRMHEPAPGGPDDGDDGAVV